jgi:hypothetical protein
VMTLRELATWEDHLDVARRRVGGSLEERDTALAGHGIYADYAACFAGYVELLDDPESAPEAFKRALFLGWMNAVEAWPLTGLGGLPEEPILSLARELDSCCRRDELDDELRWMVPWYYAAAPDALLRAQDLAALESFAAGADPMGWRQQRIDAERFGARGQMGKYWLALARPA